MNLSTLLYKGTKAFDVNAGSLVDKHLDAVTVNAGSVPCVSPPLQPKCSKLPHLHRQKRLRRQGLTGYMPKFASQQLLVMGVLVSVGQQSDQDTAVQCCRAESWAWLGEVDSPLILPTRIAANVAGPCGSGTAPRA